MEREEQRNISRWQARNLELDCQKLCANQFAPVKGFGREGHPGTCHGTGGHGPATPDNHGASPWLPPLGPVRDPVPGSSSSSSDHQRDREHVGPDPAAVHRAGKSAWNPEVRSENSGGPSSLPPQPVPTGLSQIEMSEKIVL